MKKVIIVLIILAAAGAVYAYTKKNSSDPGINSKLQTQSASETAPVSPAPSNSTAELGEGMGEVASPPVVPNPTPPPSPEPVQDDLGDVDVAPPKVFNLTGKNFSFSTSEIRVKKGDRVVINFESTDGFHDWVVDEFNAHTERVNPGTKTSVEFIADQTGTFEYYCSVSIHRLAGMKGRLIVE